MGKVSLEGMEFFAHHGFYDEEQKIGNKFGVDIHIKTNFEEAAIQDKLQKTVNYEVIYKVVAGVMLQKHRLLEHVGHQIIKDIRHQYPAVEHIEVIVSKFNPPVGGICFRSKITIEG
jgi:7,8-dihydroneopterin aldolase/epimerase/oxygenase